jgi:hypothetical protein
VRRVIKIYIYGASYRLLVPIKASLSPLTPFFGSIVPPGAFTGWNFGLSAIKPVEATQIRLLSEVVKFISEFLTEYQPIGRLTSEIRVNRFAAFVSMHRR